MSRRRVLHAAGWTAPTIVVMGAAPAFACSPTNRKSYAWSGVSYSRGSATAGTATFAPTAGSGSVKLNLSSTFGGNLEATDTADGNYVWDTDGAGLLGPNSITIDQRLRSNQNFNESLARRDHSQIVTFAFDVAVTNLRFTVTDLDSSRGQYWDRLEVSTAVTASGVSSGSARVEGQGTQAQPFRLRSANAAQADWSSNRGNVTVAIPAVQTFSLRYWNAVDDTTPSSRGRQGMYLTNIQFDACPSA